MRWAARRALATPFAILNPNTRRVNTVTRQQHRLLRQQQHNRIFLQRGEIHGIHASPARFNEHLALGFQQFGELCLIQAPAIVVKGRDIPQRKTRI